MTAQELRQELSELRRQYSDLHEFCDANDVVLDVLDFLRVDADFLEELLRGSSTVEL